MVEVLGFITAWVGILAKHVTVSTNFTLDAIVAIIAGVIILLVPRVLNYVVAFYLIIVGVIRLFNIHV